jgi:hypothetical protein
MNKQPSITLSILQPCHESWKDMTPADKGRFCLNCQKTVTDFTRLSDTELIELLRSKQASNCGRFLPEQLGRVLTTPLTVHDRRRKPFMSIAAIVTALTIVPPFAKAANTPEKVQCSVDNEGKQTATLIPHQDPASFISGIVLTDGDALPLPGATVKIKNTHIGTQADQSGNFRLRIPDNFKKKVMILEVTFIGYAKKTIKVKLKKGIKSLEVRLTSDTRMLGQYEIGISNDNWEDIPLWKKFSDTMRSIFS